MKKRILPIFLTVVVCLVMVFPFTAYAAESLDPDAQASLTLHYKKDGMGFPDLQINIYRVAEAFPDGTFQLIAPFSSYPVNIHNVTQQEQWQHIATTLCSYIVADQVSPDAQGLTDVDGTARFTDLDTGLYLVREAIGENENGVYLFNQFMIYVPTPQSDGSYEYHVEAIPKCVGFVPKTHYTVMKLWQDEGYQENRPTEIIVDIFKDGVLYDTQPLNDGNNWSYTWSVIGEETAVWTVSERNVPDSYKVTVQQNGAVFSIINTHETAPEPPPQTGDSFNPLPWILAMCISGIMLLILGIYSRRGK